MENCVRLFIAGAVAAALLSGSTACVSYKSQQVGFKPPSAHENYQQVNGAHIAATAYADRAVAKKAFGFDVRKAGLLPVQVIIDNKGATPLQIVPGQTFLIDEEGNYWNLLEAEAAYERVEKGSEYSRIAKQAGKRSVLGAAGGAIVGGAIGILTGENVGQSLGKGAAVGAAGGAIVGGAEEMSSDEAEQDISRDLRQKALGNRQIKPGIIARGFLFFPGEAPSADSLRLQIRSRDGEEKHNLKLAFPEDRGKQ